MLRTQQIIGGLIKPIVLTDRNRYEKNGTTIIRGIPGGGGGKTRIVVVLFSETTCPSSRGQRLSTGYTSRLKKNCHETIDLSPAVVRRLTCAG